MKKFLSLFTALLLLGSMTVVQAVDYYVAGTMNGWNTGSNDWKMSGSNPSSLTKQMASGTYQFKVTNGSWSWSTASFDNSLSNITLSSKDGNIQFTLSEESNVTFYYNGSKVYVQAVEVVVPSYTFTAGTTIYYDFTAYSTTGINTYVQGTEAWYGSTSSVIAITLTSDWKVTASTKLWRSGASGWNDYYCTTLPEDGQDMIVSTDGINYTWGTYGGGVLPPAAIKLHGNMKNPSWADTEEFTLASNEETASLTLTGITKGNYEFGVKIAESWTSNGSAFTRANNSHEIVAGSSGNCTFNADRNGDYTFTWTYATNTLEIGYPAIPSQSVTFTSLASEVLKGTTINLADFVTSSGIDNPGYRFYVREKNGVYGDVVSASYTFNALGEYEVKVEALEDNTGDPVASDVADVVVYQAHTFTTGTVLYVDFTAMTEGVKGVNYPKTYEAYLDYDAAGAGTLKAITFTEDVQWTTFDDFIKTEKAGWAGMKFSVPGAGENCAVVAADGLSYTWTTYVAPPPTIKMHGNFLGEWNTTDAFVLAGNNETASLTLDIQTKGEKEFGMRIGSNDNWTSNGASITRASTSAEIVAGSGNCKLNVDAKGEYTFTWTFASNTLAVTYPALPAQSVAFDGLASEVLKGTNVVFAATSSGIDNPGYRFYVREKNGVYGAAVTEYTFDALGEYEVKVEALEDNTGDPVASDVADVVVYQAHTFTTGTVLYVDFTAMSEGVKGVNYPKTYEAYLDYDAAGAGTLKAITFTEDVQWTTFDDFIKTEKAGWAGMKFSVPGAGENCAVVAADGLSYTWTTYVAPPPTIKMHGNFLGEWNTTDAFVLAGNNETASLTLTNIAVGNYEFGVRIGSDDNWTSNGSAFTRANNSHAIAAGQGNCTLNANRKGDYTFTWTFATNTLTITYPEPEAFVAGSATEIFGTTWDASAEANKMTWDEGLSKFTKTYTVDKAYKSVGLKVVYDNQWYGVNGGNDNVKFSLSGAGTFTVLFDKTNHHVDLEGDIVGDEQFDFEYVTVAGNGSGNWLNGKDWDETAEANRMTAVATDVYEISFTGVPAAESKFQFSFNGGWDYQFGGTFENFGTATTAVYGNGGGNITFTPVAGAEITIRLDLSNFNFATKEGATFTVSQIEPIAEIGGKFIINAKGDTAVFSRGNLQYNYGADKWSVAEHQYDFLGEEPNLQFGREGYTGSIDLFGWSSSESNYGRMLSNKDADYMNSTFVDWGGLFSGEKTWSTFSTSQMQYVIAHQKWTALVLDPTPENVDSGDEIYGLAMFPYDWVMPAGFEGLHYSLHDWNDEQGFADNTIALSAWSTLEAAGAVFMPMAGARAGYWGNTWNGDVETTVSNPNASGYDWVDNIGWYGYYWLSTPDSRNNYKHCANYLIFLGWGEGPTLADDDDIYYPPQVWSREKRRGNSVRLVNIIPRQYSVTYTAGEGEGTVPTDEAKYLDGEAITLAAATGLSKDGYKFAGWKFKGAIYNDTYTINNVLANEEIVFEAQWELDWQTVRENLTDGWYYTMCLEKAVAHVQGASIWRVVSKAANGNDIILEEVEGVLDAGRPYLFYATAENLEVVYNGAAVLAPVTEGNNGLVGSFTKELLAPNPNHYIIYNNELYYVNSDNVYVGAHRAYLNMTGVPAYNSGAASAPGRRRVTMAVHGEQVATGIDELNASETPVKMIIDGQLFILRGEKMFNANGQLVK